MSKERCLTSVNQDKMKKRYEFTGLVRQQIREQEYLEKELMALKERYSDAFHEYDSMKKRLAAQGEVINEATKYIDHLS